MAATTAGIADAQKQALAAWKNAVEMTFDLGTELLTLQKEYVVRVADVFGARVPKSV